MHAALVLLPKLLAEALGLSHFPAITLPGFAAGSQHKLAFEQEGVRVAYLFDGDQQGRDYQKTLLRELGKTYGVNPDFKPSGGSSWEANVRPEDKARGLTLAEGCDLEDYLHPDFYLAGIQAHIENQGLQLPVPTIQDLGTQDRPAGLKAWAEKHGVKPSQMGKMDIVEQLLDLWPECETHIDPARHAEFEEIARQVSTALGLEKLLERRLP